MILLTPLDSTRMCGLISCVSHAPPTQAMTCIFGEKNSQDLGTQILDPQNGNLDHEIQNVASSWISLARLN